MDARLRRLLSAGACVIAAAAVAGVLIGQITLQTRAALGAPSPELALFEPGVAVAPDGALEGSWAGPVTRWEGVAQTASGELPSITSSIPRFGVPLRAAYGITDRFGVPRGPDRFHGGIDLGLPDGAHVLVYSACAGTVAAASEGNVYGLHVVVDCGGGWTILLAHFSEILVVPGNAVSAAAVVGRSGSTGYSTGEHVHFETRYEGIPYDPELFMQFE